MFCLKYLFLIEEFNVMAMKIHIFSYKMGIRRSFIQWKKFRQLGSQKEQPKNVLSMYQFENENMKTKIIFALLTEEVDGFKEKDKEYCWI